MERMARNLSANHLIPSLLIFLLVQFHPSTQLSNFTDYSALTAFKSHIRSDPNGILSSNWSSSKSFCNWVGVSCSPSNDSIRRVTSLQLQGMGLQGTLAPQIANLSFLVVLDLSDNHFNSTVPSELSLLLHMKVLNISRNNLQGTIPPSISHCKELRELILSENTFVGTIPQELGILRNLQILHLSYNNLTGRVPPSLGNITKLEFFYLHDNNLEGSIPRKIGSLCNLVYLSFRGNGFTGPIPYSIFNISTLKVVNLSINQLSGHLPMENATGLNVPNLKALFLNSNQLRGHIPVSIASASRLEYLYLYENGFQGTIPHELGGLVHLKHLRLQLNQLTGTIPSSIFNLSSLTGLELRQNFLSGHIPKDIGVWLPSLEQIYLSHNQLSGAVPSSISNASKLIVLAMANNSFSGPMPPTLGHLTQLRFLTVQNNLLVNEPGKNELSFLTPLVNCRDLTHLILALNPLNGYLPETVGNLSKNLRVIDSAYCGIKGSIPQGLGNLSSLLYLGLNNNDLGGTVPASIRGLQNLQGLYLTRNRIEGPISADIFSLGRLGELRLGENMLFGSIPRLFSNLTGLAVLSLEVNRLSSTIPSSFWKLEHLREMNLSHNSLHGPLPPQVGNLKPMSYMDLSSNNLSGEIPEALGNLQLLLHLDLSSNLFTGPIPKSFGQLIIIQQMDFSSNAVSGLIPKSLEMLRDVQYMNFSFNKLEGEIPSGGAFTNLTPQSFMGNPALCGSPRFQVPPCLIHHPEKTRPSRSHTVKIVIPIICAVLFSAICLSTLIIRRAKKVKSAAPVGRSLEIGQWKMVTVHELQHATHNFSEENLLGAGSFSRVYRGTLADGMDIAVKVLKLQLEGAQESFDAECQVMGNVRHRNLAKVITACSNLDFKALVLEFMPNGSLDQWLHSQDKCLDLIHRLDIMIDVALAMEYLHHDYSVPIVHCDLKPSNVLLDDDMTAHVSDFGITKLLAGDKPEMLTSTLGTIGYIAPEYGLDGRVSTSADVYSYGILLLETFTRKKPTDDMFTGGSSLRQWVSDAFPDAVTTVVDNILLMETGTGHNRRNGTREENENENPDAIEHLLVAIIHVGLSCARESPDQRSSMRDVVTKLKKIRLSLGA